MCVEFIYISYDLLVTGVPRWVFPCYSRGRPTILHSSLDIDECREITKKKFQQYSHSIVVSATTRYLRQDLKDVGRKCRRWFEHDEAHKRKQIATEQPAFIRQPECSTEEFFRNFWAQVYWHTPRTDNLDMISYGGEPTSVCCEKKTGCHK